VARFSRKGNVLTVWVGRLDVARVSGLGTTYPQLQVRKRSGFFGPGIDIEERFAEEHLQEYAELVEWALKQRAPGV